MQAKLRVGEPDDAYEREADRVADAVLRGAVSPPKLSTLDGTLAQRTSKSPTKANSQKASQSVDDEEDAVTVQRLATLDAEPPSHRASAPITPTTLASAPSGALPASLGGTLGTVLGADFSGVQIHTDAGAARSAEQLGARAFTHGSHVYFAAGEYSPSTREGLRVLAHELTHVVQQGAAPRTATPVPVSRTSLTVQRMSVLDHSSPSNISDTNVQPWSQYPDTRGNDYHVQTDAGSDVTAWVPYNGVVADHRYWCHGFALGTYAHSMYSVYSGSGMATAVRDEYNGVANTSATAGDLAVWTTTSDGTPYGHSAKFTAPVTSSGALDEASSRLDSKNGANTFGNFSLADLVQEYGATYGVYRHR